MGFPKIRGTILGVPIIRTIVFWGLYWGPPIKGNYHVLRCILEILHGPKYFMPLEFNIFLHRKSCRISYQLPVTERSDARTPRVQVLNNHILTQNLYYNYYYQNPKYLIIGYLDPLGHGVGEGI